MTYPAAHFFILINKRSRWDCLPALFPYAKSCSGKRAATRFKAHPAVRPLIKNTESLDMVRIWCQKVACTVCRCNTPERLAAGGRCVAQLRQYRNFRRGMDMALTGAQAAAQTLISAASTASRKICLRFIITT